MRAQLPCWLSFALACASAGCIKVYEMPALNEPHAIVKLRRVFHAGPGEHRRIRIFIEDALILQEQGRAKGAPATTTATRVRPGTGRMSVESTFWHIETQWVTETYTEQVPYTDTETYTERVYQPCSSPSHGMCWQDVTRTRTVTKYRTETKTRSVVKSVDVTDDECRRFANRRFEEGHVYLLQYTYAGASRCTITCLEQFASSSPEGSTFRPCKVAR